MAKGYLTPDELYLGNIWLKTIFKPAINDQLDSTYLSYNWLNSTITLVCKDMYKSITDLSWDTSNSIYLYYLNDLTKYPYKAPDGTEYKLRKELLAKIIANMCAKAQVYWDDTTHTAQELEYFKKTIFGSALWDFYCFVSQDPEAGKLKVNVNSQNTASSTASTPRSSSSSGTSSAGHTLYKSNCSGLTTGNKFTTNNLYMYWIGGEFNTGGKTQPRIHVSPQDASTPLRVKQGSGQGYNDCILYFDNLAAANAMKDICDANKAGNVSFFEIKKVRADANGYFEVTTEYGNGYIKASKLHEELDAEKSKKAIEEACNKLFDFMN